MLNIAKYIFGIIFNIRMEKRGGGAVVSVDAFIDTNKFTT